MILDKMVAVRLSLVHSLSRTFTKRDMYIGLRELSNCQPSKDFLSTIRPPELAGFLMSILPQEVYHYNYLDSVSVIVENVTSYQISCLQRLSTLGKENSTNLSYLKQKLYLPEQEIDGDVLAELYSAVILEYVVVCLYHLQIDELPFYKRWYFKLFRRKI